jgi:hypothetical protein
MQLEIFFNRPRKAICSMLYLAGGKGRQEREGGGQGQSMKAMDFNLHIKKKKT